MARVEHKVHKVVIVGDFNDEKFRITGFTEIKHPEFFHKHQKNTRKTYIDKVFSNDDTVKIIGVLPTCENKIDRSLGHKFVVIRIGSPKPDPKAPPKIAYSAAKIKMICSNSKILDSMDFHMKLKNCTDVETKAKLITDACCSILSKSKVHVRSNAPKHLAIDKLNECVESLTSKPTAMKNLVRFRDSFRHGLTAEPTKPTPTNEQHRNKLQSKLEKLHPVNIPLAFETVDQMYSRPAEDKKFLELPSKSLFLKLIQDANPSGALDIHGLSLKFTKIILRFSKSLADAFYELFCDIAESGIIPSCFKEDKINHIYKNKGDYSHPDYWRPITIAPSLGKHIDKVLIFYLNKIWDCNNDNHAYRPKHNCQSAVVQVQIFLKEAAIIAENDPDHLYVPLIDAEDISSAFESIAGPVLDRILYHTVAYNGEFRIRELVASYLDRKSLVANGNGPPLEITKKFLNRTSPQGSSLSPKFWRFYDGVFTALYKSSLDTYAEAHPNVVMKRHRSFADDKLTLMLLKFNKNTPLKLLVKLRSPLLEAPETS